MRKLVESDEVLLTFQIIGTPSKSAVQKYLNAKKVPQLFAAASTFAAARCRITLFYALQSPNSRWWGFWINCVAMSTCNQEIQAQQAKRFDRQREFWIKLIDEGKRPRKSERIARPKRPSTKCWSRCMG